MQVGDIVEVIGGFQPDASMALLALLSGEGVLHGLPIGTLAIVLSSQEINEVTYHTVESLVDGTVQHVNEKFLVIGD